TSSINIFSTLQMNEWAYVSAKPGLASVLGARPQRPTMSYLAAQQEAQIYGRLPYRAYSSVPTVDGSYGLLGTMEGRYYINFSIGYTTAFNGFNPYPYYSSISGTDDNDLDDILSQTIQDMIVSLAGLNKSVLTIGKPNVYDLAKFYSDAAAITSKMPHSAIYLDSFNNASLSARIILHVGTDNRLQSAASFPPVGIRMLTQIAQLGQSLVRTFSPTTLGNATITQGIRAFPQVRSTKLSIAISSYIGRILYPFGISFLLPIFVITMVKGEDSTQSQLPSTNYCNVSSTFTEKEDKIFVMMKMNGMKRWAYYLSHYVTFLILSILSVAVFLISGKILRLEFFTQTEAGVLILVFVIWANAYTMKMIVSGNEIYTALVFMIVEIFVYGLIAAYLTLVMPTEFGISKPWHFPVTDIIRWYQKMKRAKTNNGKDPLSESQMALAVEVDPAELAKEDDDVRAEKERVSNLQYDPTSPLVVSHMRKVYGGRGGLGPKLAVKDVSFAAESGLVFGLLGPNGAGKTTLISILTGLYDASSGHATVAGFDIKNDTSEVFKHIGICPQFDILWDDLTVSEHLYFYARLKGTPAEEEEITVEQALKRVSLTSLKDRYSKRLSGGEKRRLSIAIALLGSPAVVFLDEPTTGLDPEVRRLIWSIIQDAREGKTIVLTTHSMEEAEALCQRIGIMAKGTLRCLANPLRLKKLYGTGFRVFFNTDEERTYEATQFIEGILPKGWVKMDSFATNTSYEFPPSPGILPFLFETIEAQKQKHGILDWGVSQTTLEEVFLKVISDNDANAD
ncbi:hypothetical protein HDU76_005822, partial [Blyttiomyces sp. JEL0837]